eukprot:gene4785-5968_t
MTDTFQCIKTLSSHQGSVLSVRYNVDGSYCMTGSQDKTIKLWNPTKGLLVHTFTGHGYEVQDVCSSHDSRSIFSCADRQLYQWDVTTGEVIKRFQGHSQTINCIAVNHDNTLLFTGSTDRTVKIWDIRSRSTEPIQVADDAADTVTSIFVNEKNSVRQFITGSVDGGIRTYDALNGTITISTEEFPISSVSLTNDCRFIIASSTDHCVRLIDRNTMETFKEYKGHKNSVYKINSRATFDDRLIVSGSEDNNVYLWKMLDAKILTTLTGHTNIVTSIDCHPSRLQILSASMDGTVRVWGTNFDD